MKLPRSSGVLLHISSLPGKHGIGTLGQEAEEFISFLKDSGVTYWQILPTGPVSSSMCYSPYSCTSVFAGNRLLISLDEIRKEEWFTEQLNIPEMAEGDYVEFHKAEEVNSGALDLAFSLFNANGTTSVMKEFNLFREENRSWLDDYALYEILAQSFNSYEWTSWEEPYAKRFPEVMDRLKDDHSEEIEKIEFIQFIFFKQWKRIKKIANDNGINIIGDIPIYMSMNSSDSWANTGILQIDVEKLKPSAIAGVPPDYFSETGQLWGNPLYKWKDHGKFKEETMTWWLSRISRMLKLVDFIRIDHFRGLESFWAVKYGEETAMNGQWVKGPGEHFFTEVKRQFGEIPLLAEDLGIITKAVEKLRDDFELPGMKILQFAFDFNNDNDYLPHNIENRNCILYTGTHDNNTTNGWFYGEEVTEDQRRYIMEYLGIEEWSDFHWKLIRSAMASTANLVMIPAQDLLGYGGDFRMNKPSTIEDNWDWKLKSGTLNSGIASKLRRMNYIYRRGSLKMKVES